MPVTDEQIAALRAQLAGEHDEHRRLLAELDARGELPGYMALVTAAFIEAADRRFGSQGADDAAVIAFVGDVRSRYPGADDAIDPDVAERALLKALGRGSVSDITGPALGRTELLLLPLMLAEENLSSAELDQFLATARSLLDS